MQTSVDVVRSLLPISQRQALLYQEPEVGQLVPFGRTGNAGVAVFVFEDELNKYGALWPPPSPPRFPTLGVSAPWDDILKCYRRVYPITDQTLQPASLIGVFRK